MKPELSNYTDDAIKRVIEIFNQGIDGATVIVPEFLNQVIRWHIVSYAISSVIGIIIFCACICTGKWAYNRLKEDDCGFPAQAAIIFSLIFGITSVVSTICGVIEVIRGVFAPYVVILDYLKGLV